MRIDSPMLCSGFPAMNHLAAGLILELTVVIMPKRSKRCKISGLIFSSGCTICPLLARGLILALRAKVL